MFRRQARVVSSMATLPGYADLTEIGGGAFATVYRATEADTGRAVALKILKLDSVHPHLIETFEREIQALAQVSDHPNIVTLYRPTTTGDGRPVLVLELCRESLAEQVRRSGPLRPQDVSRVGVKIAGALETAHRTGFLHRDMKPQNILVTQFGEPALADFGVAALQASAQATAGVFGFTTLHAAPEILEGNRLSPATDVYGLASTMYQLLTGMAPFATFDNEAPASVILRILRDPVQPLRSADIPLELSDLLEDALAKDPSGRPGSAAEFAMALQQAEQTAGWSVTPYTAWGPTDGGNEGDAAPHRPVREDPPAKETLYPSPPSVRVESVVQPLAEPPAPPAEPRPEAAPAAAARSGPSVTAPEFASRRVMTPTGTVRGQPRREIPPRADLAPLNDPAGRDPNLAASRPVFVDPGQAVPGPEAIRPNRSIYEETVLPAAGRLGRAGPGESLPSDGRSRRIPHLPVGPALAVAGLALAVAVVAVAILLVVGVL